MPSNHLIFCRSLVLLPSIFPNIRVFSNESVLCIRQPKYWSFSFSINPSNEYSGLISFRIDWFGLLAVQGTLKSLLQHHSSKASILWCSAFFIVQLSHPYMTTGNDSYCHFLNDKSLVTFYLVSSPCQMTLFNFQNSGNTVQFRIPVVSNISVLFQYCQMGNLLSSLIYHSRNSTFKTHFIYHIL